MLFGQVHGKRLRAGCMNPKEYYVCFGWKKGKGKNSGGKKHAYNGKWDMYRKNKLANTV